MIEIQTARGQEYNCCTTRGLQHCYFNSCTTQGLQYYYNSNCCAMTRGSAGRSIIIIPSAQQGGCCIIIITTAQHGVHNMVSYITKQHGVQECWRDGTQMSGNIRAARELVVAHEATTFKSATSLPPPACCHQPEPGAIAWRHQVQIKSLNKKTKIEHPYELCRGLNYVSGHDRGRSTIWTTFQMIT
jgi:hypothetical protein